MQIDSHLLSITVGEVLLDGARTKSKSGWRMFLYTAKGCFSLNACQLLTLDGKDLFDREQAPDVELLDYLDKALITKIQRHGNQYRLSLSTENNQSQLTGNEVAWSVNDRPTIHMITALSSAVDTIKDCGCVLNQQQQVIEWCCQHQPSPSVQSLPYEEVDGGTVDVRAGECDDCGEVVKVIGFLAFAECSCIRD